VGELAARAAGVTAAMQAIMPAVFLDDDPMPQRPMARHVILVGFSVARVLWRFGFVPNSDLAEAFGVYTQRPLWVLAMPSGRPLETALLAWNDPAPARFLHVVEARLA